MSARTKSRRESDFSSHICGIPCGVIIKTLVRVKADCRADNPWDFAGYDEIDLEIVDRRGYPAPWLASKLTDREYGRLCEEAISTRQSEDY